MAAMDRFRIRHRPFSLTAGNAPSCPEADLHGSTDDWPGRWEAVIRALKAEGGVTGFVADRNGLKVDDV